jgi:hypothetical protein
VNKVALEQVLLRALHFPLSVSLFYQTDMQATHRNLHTSDALMGYRGALDRKPLSGCPCYQRTGRPRVADGEGGSQIMRVAAHMLNE